MSKVTKILIALSAYCSAIFALAAPSYSQSETIEGVAAIVNDQVISLSDVRERARLMVISSGVQMTEEMQAEMYRRAMESLIEEKLQLQEAEEFELEVESEDIDQELTQMAQQVGATLPEFLSELNRFGIKRTGLTNQIKAEISWQRLMQGLYGRRIRISDLQIDDVVNRIRKSQAEPQWHVAEIFLREGVTGERDQLVGYANQLRARIIDGSIPFQSAAKQFSIAPSAAAGGDLGWVNPGELRVELSDGLEGLTAPALSEPIPVENGVYLIGLLETRASTTSSESYTLKQILAADLSPLEAARYLSSLNAEISDCAGVDDVAERNGFKSVQLGKVSKDDLSEDFQRILTNTEVDTVSQPFALAGGSAFFFVCDREVTGARLPSRDQIENRLFSQHLALISDRHLRNLKREATIIRR